jgi:ABC-type multidrug transport system fused ATPase/permease subunit
MQDRVGDAATRLTESFGAARVVRGYRLEAAEEARANALFTRLREAIFGIQRTRASLDPMLEVLGGLAVAAVLGVVGFRVASGQGTIGEFTGFVAAVLIAARPVRALGSLNSALQEGLAGLARVFGVIDTPRQIASYAFTLVAAGAFWLAFVVSNNWSTVPVLLGLVLLHHSHSLYRSSHHRLVRSERHAISRAGSQ